jgi:tetratricopeptide (TPR) repeat protein
VTIGVGALLGALIVVPRVRARPVLDLRLEAGLVPEEAIAFAERHGLRDRMYNDLEVGSYLTWEGWPRHRVFQDPRINGYPDEFHAVLRRADLGRAEWQRFLDRFSVDAALVTYPGVNPRGALFEPRLWALVYRGADALVFTRRLPARSALIAARELPVTFDYSAEGGLVARPIPAPPGPVPACEWQRRLGDFHAGHDEAAERAAYQAALDPPGCLPAADERLTRRALGALVLRQGDAARALDLLQGLDDAQAGTNRAFALLALSRPAEALAALDGVLRAEPANDEARFGRALALEALGRRAEAAAAYEDFLARAPHHLAAPRARERLRQLRPR